MDLLGLLKCGIQHIRGLVAQTTPFQFDESKAD
jgi:hypothetical protein